MLNKFALIIIHIGVRVLPILSKNCLKALKRDWMGMESATTM